MKKKFVQQEKKIDDDWNFGFSHFHMSQTHLEIRTFILTFGTNIRSMLKKQQKIIANATNANEASCCDAIT